MKLFSYLDNRYQAANLELQKEFSPEEKAKTMAITKIIAHHKSVLAFFYYFKFLGLYIVASLLKKWPEPIDFLKELSAIQEEKKQQHSKDSECAAKNVVQLPQQN